MTIAQQVNYAMTQSSVAMSGLSAEAQAQIAQAMQRVVDALNDDGEIFGPSLWSDQSQWCQDLAVSDSGVDAARYYAWCRSWEAKIQQQLSALADLLRHFGRPAAAEVADSAAGAVGGESEAAGNVTTPDDGGQTLTSAAWVLAALAALVLVVRR
jgi:MYXO-CTERM domain-containing protein